MSNMPAAETRPRFDLPAYLARIGLTERPAADAAGLAMLQRAHRLAIPFENFDVILGRGIAIDSANVFAKLVVARRGGYCFEHGRLFLDALLALGFEAHPLLARVWLRSPSGVPPITHTLALVTIDGAPWIADAGFGGSYSPPMRLVDGEEAVAPDGARFRLALDAEHRWMLSRSTGGEWQPQISFDAAPASEEAVARANHWVHTAPESRFVRHRIATMVLPNGIAVLEDRHYHRRSGDRSVEAEIHDPRVYRMRLGLLFGIDLSAVEVAALGLFGTP